MTDATQTTEWQPIDIADEHIRDVASITLMEPGRFRARLYAGPANSLYAFWNGGEAGTPATLWVRLPDVPISEGIINAR